MKQIIFLLISSFILSGCADKKAQKKVMLDSVLAVHDKVMSADEQLMKNKLLLDSLTKQKDSPTNDTAEILSKKLNAADSAMDKWMHDFDYEQKGKSNDESIAYYKLQKNKIMAIDSALNATVDASNKYLSKLKKR